ncbi:Cytochrome c [Neorhodopirellula pilleata]|uniref:Cytochrome c n=2 Tax=Neorhodopirellula pilleata TaxID=2714738 RepID=A0A5C6A340_9BACT|nr:Cytochrome c [Neorhodopirellula pilleata]
MFRDYLIPAFLFVVTLPSASTLAQTLKNPPTLGEQLLAAGADHLAVEADRRGDPRRGALIFFKSAAACVQCHSSGDANSPLGPNLSTLGAEISTGHVIESLLRPSARIRKGYETVSVLTLDGEVLTGLIERESATEIVLRSASDLLQSLMIEKSEIESINLSSRSMMPDGLMSTMRELRDFYDLVKYVTEVAHGGPTRAKELRPSDEQLAVVDDSADLDHAGIIKGMRTRDFEAGQQIYHSYCFDCHGTDGRQPSLPTARAFATEELKYGADPYRMFMTLTRGNGLMAAMNHLTPKERYQVVHYIREQFMKPTNPAYVPVTKNYLEQLPNGTRDGTEIRVVDRDHGPALASQLRRDLSSVLNVKLGGRDTTTIAYDLHTMNQAGVWQGGFVDSEQTQHQRDRGEGTINPGGRSIAGLEGWEWGHDQSFDYPREGLLPRGPYPANWMNFHGYHLHNDDVVLSYAIDEREVLERPMLLSTGTIAHTLNLQPGQALVLAVASPEVDQTISALSGIAPLADNLPAGSLPRVGEVSNNVAFVIEDQDGSPSRSTLAAVIGDTEGMRWQIDSAQRMVLQIPNDDEPRRIAIVRHAADTWDRNQYRNFVDHVRRLSTPDDLNTFTHGGDLRWPQPINTVGVPGIEQGGYALDTLTIPDSTPWNTWFRTSALDFFSDGRMALATYGGDIWIVSGIDTELRNLRWKRYAAGLYEPFGLKIVDDVVHVTCKDRLIRLTDSNGDNEADYYESLSADTDVSVNFHAFNFDLQTDLDGNFYYAKSGHGADFALPGAVIQVSPDGRRRSVFSTGFRTPNGMGALPDGRITVSDNQGQWTPASKISLLRPGGYYGWVPNYSLPGKWHPDGGKIDLETVQPPESFDPPIVWMPQNFDNSSGGQLWVDDARFGPLSGHLLHTSFGKGWMSYCMMQTIDDVTQAAIVKLPFDFRTGIMRARVNPLDGQVYAVGLQGWNGGARPGLQGEGVQRLRYTGKEFPMVTDCQVVPDGLRISFNFNIDEKSLRGEWLVAECWNYQRRSDYGSKQYSPSTGEPGVDTVNIRSVKLGDDRRSLHLRWDDMQPVDQVHLVFNLTDDNDQPFMEEVYWTINQVP